MWDDKQTQLCHNRERLSTRRSQPCRKLESRRIGVVDVSFEEIVRGRIKKKMFFHVVFTEGRGGKKLIRVKSHDEITAV